MFNYISSKKIIYMKTMDQGIPLLTDFDRYLNSFLLMEHYVAKKKNKYAHFLEMWNEIVHL